jgi:hypothetical protein
VEVVCSLFGGELLVGRNCFKRNIECFERSILFARLFDPRGERAF